MHVDLYVKNESATFKGMHESFCSLASQQFKPFLVQVNWLLHFFDCTDLGPTVILTALTCLDKGLETGGFKSCNRRTALQVSFQFFVLG